MLVQQILNIVLRTILGFILILTLTRLMGRKAISQMSFFDFVTAITIGAITANLAIDAKSPLYVAAIALIVFVILSIIVDFLHIKDFNFRKLVNSEPAVVIENGKINNQNMKKLRLAAEDLTKRLREKNIFNIADVEFAILENDGELSVLPKSQKQPLTPSDMKISTSYTGLTKDIIIDGNIMHENLKDSNLDTEWLISQLLSQGFKNENDIFYAGLDTSGNLYVSPKSHKKESHGMYGIE